MERKLPWTRAFKGGHRSKSFPELTKPPSKLKEGEYRKPKNLLKKEERWRNKWSSSNIKRDGWALERAPIPQATRVPAKWKTVASHYGHEAQWKEKEKRTKLLAWPWLFIFRRSSGQNDHEIGGQLKGIFVNFSQVKDDNLLLLDEDHPLPQKDWLLFTTHDGLVTKPWFVLIFYGN